MNIINCSVLFFFSLSLFIINSQSITYPPDQYICFRDLVKKFNLPYTITNSTDFFEYCTKRDGIAKCDAFGYVIGLSIQSFNQTEILKIEDIHCFLKIDNIRLEGFSLQPDFIYYKFSTCSTFNVVNIISGLNGGISKPLPPYYTMAIGSKDLNGSKFKMSYINNISSFTLYGSFVDLEIDDLAIKNELSILSIYLNSFPNFTGYTNLNSLTLYFSEQFVKSSISNYAYVTSRAISINHKSKVPFYFFQNDKQRIKYIYTTGELEKPTSMIIDSFNNSFEFLSIQSVGDQFNYNGLLPFSKLNVLNFLMVGGNLTSIPNDMLFGLNNNVALQSNKIDTILPLFGGTARSFDLSSNKIKGTIDSSWCSTQLIIKNNLMTGTIPGCFACYLNSSTSIGLIRMYERFGGNNFSNYDKSIPCTTFRPRADVIRDKKGLLNRLSLYGDDIGFELATSWKVNSTIDLNIETVEMGKRYIGYLNSLNESFAGVSYFDISFTDPFSVTYTFPTTKQPPTLKKITVDGVSGMDLLIQGLYFSSYQGYVVQSVYVDNIKCNIYETSFKIIKCTLDSQPISIDNNLRLVKLTVDTNPNISNYVYWSSGFVNEKECLDDCSAQYNGNGICRMDTGQCVCGSTNSSLCKVSCLDNCNSNGICNTTTGVCECFNDKWAGETCLIPYHFISSIESTTTDGGVAVFNGFFGDVHDQLYIKINQLDCPITLNTSIVIKCLAPPNSVGFKPLLVYQNEISIKSVYNYIPKVLGCPKDCSNKGGCDYTTGICNCNSGYSGPDCSYFGGSGTTGILTLPSTNTSIDETTGSTTINNQEVSFQIYFKSLFEIDFNGNKVECYSLQNSNWIADKFNIGGGSNNQIHRFTQQIQNGSCTIVFGIEEILDTNGKQYEFTGTIFKLESGSIKITISISNYQYQNNLNTLKLDLVSSVDQQNVENQQNNQCNEKETSINTNNGDQQSFFNYIKISKNQKVLSGRFINKLLSDGKPTFFETTTSNDSDSSVIVSLSLPHCIDECIIDPDFSLLIDTDFKPNCNTTSSKKWVIPVAVVSSVVGIAALIVFGFIIYKRSTTLKVQIHKLKRFG